VIGPCNWHWRPDAFGIIQCALSQLSAGRQTAIDYCVGGADQRIDQIGAVPMSRASQSPGAGDVTIVAFSPAVGNGGSDRRGRGSGGTGSLQGLFNRMPLYCSWSSARIELLDGNRISEVEVLFAILVGN